MSAQDTLNRLSASLTQMQSQIGTRLGEFEAESITRQQAAKTEQTAALDLLRNAFDSNLAQLQSARLDLEAFNTLLQRNVGSAQVGFSRFTNPTTESSLRPMSAFGRTSTIGASQPGFGNR
jgi:hypothetical protein